MKHFSTLLLTLSLLTTVQIFGMSESEYQTDLTILQERKTALETLFGLFRQERRYIRNLEDKDAALESFYARARVRPLIDDLNNRLLLLRNLNSAVQNANEQEFETYEQQYLQRILSNDHSENYLQVIGQYIYPWIEESTDLGNAVTRALVAKGIPQSLAIYEGVLSMQKFFNTAQETFMITNHHQFVAHVIIQEAHQEENTPTQPGA
jgi:hypothetical protein